MSLSMLLNDVSFIKKQCTIKMNILEIYVLKHIKKYKEVENKIKGIEKQLTDSSSQ